MIYNNVKTLKLGDKRVLRVINKEKAVFPNVVSDGLILWYDLEGYTNQSVSREVAHDYSGNGRNGSLKNFLFDAESGYNNGLIFDGVDDFIQLPELNLDVDDYSVQLNDKIYSFRGEQVAHTTQSNIDSAINAVEIGGRNLILNSGFTSTNGWRSITGSILGVNNGELSFSAGSRSGWRALMSSSSNLISLEAGYFYTVSYQLMLTDSTKSIDFQLGFSRYSLPDPTAPGANRSLNVRSQIDPNLVDEWQTVKATVQATHDVDTSAYLRFGISNSVIVKVRRVKVEKGTIPTDWAPAPEDLLSTQFKTTEKLKSLRYWNRALTDSELLTMYNIEKKR